MITIVSFPVSFGERTCDRDFLIRLKSRGSLGEAEARLILFQLWFAFAKGEGPSMAIGEFTDQIIEETCGWQGESGQMICSALEARFLVRDGEGEQARYSLTGYSDANKSSLSTVTSKGGKLRWVTANLKKSQQEAGELFKFMRATKDSTIEEGDEESSKRAMVIGMNLCRSVGLPSPSKSDFQAGYFHKCLALAREFSDEEMLHAYRFIALHKADESIVPRDRDLLAKPERIKGYLKVEP